MTRLWVRCSSTASRPAASASTLLPVPAGPPMDDDADRRVGEQVEGDALLGRAAVDVEEAAVAPHEVHPLVVVHPAERRLRAGDERHAGVARAGRGPRRGRRRARRRARRSSSASTSSSTKPVQACRRPSSLRYSSASSPTMRAFSRSGRSLVTTVTSRPSAARLRATARMRWSLLSAVSDAGRHDGRWWLSSTRSVPPLVVDRQRLGERAVLDAEAARAGAAPAGPPTPARGGRAWPPAPSAPRSAARPRARRSARTACGSASSTDVSST